MDVEILMGDHPKGIFLIIIKCITEKMLIIFKNIFNINYLLYIYM